MSLTQFVVPTFSQMLRSLSGWLDKAAAHETAGGAEGDALMAKRLAPDMYPLSSQVRFACFQALEVAARLRSQPLPPSAEKVRSDGWSGGEQPGSIADAKACVAQTLAVLADLGPGALDGGSAAPVVIELRDGIIFVLLSRHDRVRDPPPPRRRAREGRSGTSHVVVRPPGIDAVALTPAGQPRDRSRGRRDKRVIEETRMELRFAYGRPVALDRRRAHGGMQGTGAGSGRRAA